MAESESKQGLNELQDGFGGGKVTPTQIALQLRSTVVSNGSIDVNKLGSVEEVSAELAGLHNVKQVISPTRPNGVLIDYTNSTVLGQYQATILHMISPDGRSVLMTVVFVAEPYNKASIASIQDIRDVASGLAGGPNITKMYVGGSTASMFDIANMVQSDFGSIEYLVVIGIYVVLLVVLGSVLSPLKSILTILLSISWTLAVTLILFQLVIGQPVLYMVPMILFVVCLGLGMDYDILLITRIREEVSKGRDNHDAIVHAMEKTGGIITACGIIMAAAFGSMMLSSGYLLKEFGFALMFAILLDATIVRIYLVPAIMSLLGKWNWWAPGPLQRMTDRHNEKRAEELRQDEESIHFEEAGDR
jgi:RND superfamily putative drug exporter